METTTMSTATADDELAQTEDHAAELEEDLDTAIEELYMATQDVSATAADLKNELEFAERLDEGRIASLQDDLERAKRRYDERKREAEHVAHELEDAEERVVELEEDR